MDQEIADLLKVVIPSLVTLVVGFFGYRYAISQLKVERKYDFYMKQLYDFYAPLLGYRKEILAKSEVRVKVAKASNDAWKEICDNNGTRDNFDYDEAYEPFKRIIEYDNSQFNVEILPKYQQMLKVFTDCIWLAEPETRKWYKDFLEFVEIWTRCIDDSLPGEVVEKLEHHEKNLKAFYEDLEYQVEKIRKKITG